MKIIKEEGLFVRKEEKLGKINTLIYSCRTNEMYEASEEYYDVIQMCNQEVTFEILQKSVKEKYTMTDEMTIRAALLEMVEYLKNIGVLKVYE